MREYKNLLKDMKFGYIIQSISIKFMKNRENEMKSISKIDLFWTLCYPFNSKRIVIVKTS